jgi:hypothetical protein
VIHSPIAGDVRAARLVVADVPDKTTVQDVAAALREAGRAADFSEGGVEFGNHEIRAEGRGGWPKGIASLEDAPAVRWAALLAPPTSGDARRITLRLAPAKHAAYTLAADRQGISLQQWCEAALDGAAQARIGIDAAAPHQVISAASTTGKATGAERARARALAAAEAEADGAAQ